MPPWHCRISRPLVLRRGCPWQRDAVEPTKDEDMMINRLLVAMLALAVPAAADAQGPTDTRSIDATYCRTLAQEYNRLRPVMEAPTAKDALLASDCERNPSGTTASLSEKDRKS